MAWLVACLLCSFAAVVPGEEHALRARMRSALETLTIILPISLSPKRDLSADELASIRAGLDSLAADANAIERHFEASSGTHSMLSHVFGSDVAGLRRDLEAERYDRVRRGLLGLTSTCFACHSKLPAADLGLGRELLQAAPVQSLPLYQRAVLAGAVRRFDQALAYYEALFRSAPLATEGFTWTTALERYLLLALRVRQDPARAAAVLSAFSERDGLPPYLRRYVERWVTALGQLELDAGEDQELERARALFARAQRNGAYPADPATKVHYIAISSLLHRYLLRADQGPQARSEAWYLLGVAEFHLSSTYWTGQTEYFLERAILAAPGTAAAQRAYRFLEDYLILEYSGSAGISLPPELAARLAELERRAVRPGP